MSDWYTAYEIIKVMAWCKENLNRHWLYYPTTAGKDLRFIYHVEAVFHFEGVFEQTYFISFENEADYCLFYLTWG